MLDIQREGTPTSAPAPASSPKTRRRVIGTGGLLGTVGAVRHHRYMGGAAQKGTRRRKVRIFKVLPWWRNPGALTFLDFWVGAAFNPATFSERLSFRPADRPLRPEVNARQRCAPSGVKVFGRSFAEEVVIPREGRVMTVVNAATLREQDKGQRHCSTICRNGLAEFSIV
ncbi:hypothetical protein [Bradyrhizobium sp. Y36]|uniref:hypothetical protein n=1 Tax=Bradyrhizobium sp. Y36 TaxID=2035447 RepID=UPI0018E9C812|nr:hypothetical protein [Bradyrhizobium sp. Y36]